MKNLLFITFTIASILTLSQASNKGAAFIVILCMGIALVSRVVMSENVPTKNNNNEN